MLQYEIEGKIAVITGCSATDTEIEIPEYIESCPVGKIAPKSFNKHNKLRRVTFPRTLRLIGEYAFAGCKNLKEIFFSEGLETIEDWAFISCDISEVILPTTIKSIGDNAFMGNNVKHYIDDFISSNRKSRKTKEERRENMTIFPIGLIDSIDNITNDIITDRARYHFGLIDSYDTGVLNFSQLDIPFVFDGDEFILAIYSQSQKKDFQIIVDVESKKKIGKYELDDPDFLDIRFNVLAGKENLGELCVKTPYLEDAEFKILEVIQRTDRGNLYFLRVKANLSCFGNGNPDSEFKFNIFDELKGKFLSQYQRALISEAVYNDIIAQIDFEAIDTLKSYLTQVIGSPIMSYYFEMFETIMNDPEFTEKEKLQKYNDMTLRNIYQSLGSFETFEEACFSFDKAVAYFSRITGLKKDELTAKYEYYLRDDDGNELTINDMKAYREVFVENEYNFTLYADYLNYMYQLMSRMNQEFSMRTYQE